MEMRTLRCTGISAERNELSLAYGNFAGSEMYIAIVAMMCILPAFHSCLYLWSKAVKVYIEAGIAVGVCDDECFPEAIFAHDGTRDVSVGDGIDAEVYPTFGFYIYSAVEMVGSGLSKVPCKLYMYVHRGTKRECCKQ